MLDLNLTYTKIRDFQSIHFQSKMRKKYLLAFCRFFKFTKIRAKKVSEFETFLLSMFREKKFQITQKCHRKGIHFASKTASDDKVWKRDHRHGGFPEYRRHFASNFQHRKQTYCTLIGWSKSHDYF